MSHIGVLTSLEVSAGDPKFDVSFFSDIYQPLTNQNNQQTTIKQPPTKHFRGTLLCSRCAFFCTFMVDRERLWQFLAVFGAFCAVFGAEIDGALRPTRLNLSCPGFLLHILHHVLFLSGKPFWWPNEPRPSFWVCKSHLTG